jgi:hypothetical protein
LLAGQSPQGKYNQLPDRITNFPMQGDKHVIGHTRKLISGKLEATSLVIPD